MKRFHLYRVKGEWFCRASYRAYGKNMTTLGVASRSPKEAWDRFFAVNRHWSPQGFLRVEP